VAAVTSRKSLGQWLEEAIAGSADPLSYLLMNGSKAVKRAPLDISGAVEEVTQRLRSDLERWWML